MPTMNPWQGLFYYPGRLRIPENSIVTELVAMYPHELVVLSLSDPIEPAQGPIPSRRQLPQEHEHARASSLVINVLGGVEASMVEQVKSTLYSGAVLSFHHPLDPFPYITKSNGYLPQSLENPDSPILSSSSSSSFTVRESGSLKDCTKAPIVIAQLHLLPGVLPPDQDEKAGVVLYKEREPNVMRFREMVERRVERLSEG
ncbi:BQ2448_4175 [Microbotryum intermedium]|uniref:BQ2448_4175 protein n=1 Tax=Microbotryum intermedium TaxID=269621 RepID=A0A238FN67_9BASI|nr:BQ2448_4175 [Microbotryum intermedium]